jgi:hypothetical protein
MCVHAHRTRALRAVHITTNYLKIMCATWDNYAVYLMNLTAICTAVSIAVSIQMLPLSLPVCTNASVITASMQKYVSV